MKKKKKRLLSFIQLLHHPQLLFNRHPPHRLLHSDNSHLADSTRLGLVTCVSSVRWPHVTADINTVRVQLACSVSTELKLLRIRHLAVRRATAFRFAFCGGTPQD
jgi:hypothetical protein